MPAKIRRVVLYIPAYGCLLFVFLAVGQPLSADMPGNQTLLYSLQYDGIDAGELEVVIEHADDRLRTTATSRPRGIARLFLSEQTVETRYRVEGNTAILEGGRLYSQDGDRADQGYLIDQKNRMIRFLNTTDQPILEDDLLGASDFPILLMTTEMSRIGGMTVRELTPEKSRYYIYETPVKEDIILNGNSYPAWKVIRNKRSEKNRSVTVWLDPGNRLIPLRIVSTKGGRSTVLTLLNHPASG